MVTKNKNTTTNKNQYYFFKCMRINIYYKYLNLALIHTYKNYTLFILIGLITLIEIA